MRLLVVLFGAFALMMYIMVVAGCAHAEPVARGPIAVKRSFAGCTPERDGRQQCCFATKGQEPVCVWTAAPRKAHAKVAKR